MADSSEHPVGASPIIIVKNTAGQIQDTMNLQKRIIIINSKGQQVPVNMLSGVQSVRTVAAPNSASAILKNIAAATAGGSIQSPQPQTLKMPGLGSQTNMGSVLSAIAAHLKKNKPHLDGGGDNSSNQIRITNMADSLDLQRAAQQAEMITQAQAVPHMVKLEEGVAEVVEEEPVSIIQTFSPSDLPSRYEAQESSVQEENPLVVDTSQLSHLPEGTLVNTEYGTFSVQHSGSSESLSEIPEELSGPCPICGDRISGYHYGIYSCESCKGFFKRTVQNGRSFVCHRNGDCEIDIVNRKKCPACRFARCITYGMKLEAIRGDRTRGGRSSYSGCSPVVRKATPQKRPRNLSVTHSVGEHDVSAVSPTQLSESDMHSIHLATADPVSGISLSPDETGPEGGLQAPHTPQVIEDLLTLESLVAEDDIEPDCCEGRLDPGDENQFASILHLADHCLYRIVRWARNLPEFSNVSTDDQIVLLQNCWADLLCFSVCYQSSRGDGTQLLIANGRSVTMETAEAVDLVEVIGRLIDLTCHLKQLEVDSHEFAAFKVMILMNPDVEGLKEKSIIRDYQERILESLLIHSVTHYPNMPNKLAEQLLRLAELTRTCTLGKEELKKRQEAGEVPAFSLLSELLKGAVASNSGSNPASSSNTDTAAESSS